MNLFETLNLAGQEVDRKYKKCSASVRDRNLGEPGARVIWAAPESRQNASCENIVSWLAGSRRLSLEVYYTAYGAPIALQAWI